MLPIPCRRHELWWPVQRRARAGTTDDDGEDSNGVPAARSHLRAKAWRRHTWLHGHSTAARSPGNMARIGQRVLPERRRCDVAVKNDTAQRAGTPPLDA